MHSTMSTCPQVGAICYPPFLGITKEMMSRGPHVADMEHREADEQAGVDDCSYVRHSPAYKPVRCGSLQLCETFSRLQT
jgi:hypothetical protein